mmetsp:Transcript_47638/g.149305  ORF Transcript_47638/g.149305 Transcript_47638/m.149305 type:complete len:241 (-) Transcript_47638:455-1177(-)
MNTLVDVVRITNTLQATNLSRPSIVIDAFGFFRSLRSRLQVFDLLGREVSHAPPTPLKLLLCWWLVPRILRINLRVEVFILVHRPHLCRVLYILDVDRFGITVLAPSPPAILVGSFCPQFFVFLFSFLSPFLELPEVNVRPVVPVTTSFIEILHVLKAPILELVERLLEPLCFGTCRHQIFGPRSIRSKVSLSKHAECISNMLFENRPDLNTFSPKLLAKLQVLPCEGLIVILIHGEIGI